MEIAVWGTLVNHTSFFRQRMKFTTFLDVKEVILGQKIGPKIGPQVDQDSGGSPHFCHSKHPACYICFEQHAKKHVHAYKFQS